MTLVRSQVKTGRASGNLIVQDYQNPAYAATVSLTTYVEDTLIQIALTGACTIDLTLTNALVGDRIKFLLSADSSNRAVTYSIGFTSSTTDTVTANSTGVSEFVYNGTSWDKATYNYQSSPVDIQTPAYAATISLTTTLRETKLIPALLTGALTINAVVTSAIAGDTLRVDFSADTTNRVVTFGTNFASAGTLTVTASKFAGISFMYNGTVWVEQGRAITV